MADRGNWGSHEIDLGWIATVFGGNPSVPFVPTCKETLDLVLSAMGLTKGDVLYDLGCGDGRVIVEAARRYPIRKAVCIELRRELAEEARSNALKAGVADKVVVINDDFFRVPISDATVVYMYLLTSVNETLKPKLKKELRPSTRMLGHTGYISILRRVDA
jgi:tRNA A58 N-methylase Trm61